MHWREVLLSLAIMSIATAGCAASTSENGSNKSASNSFVIPRYSLPPVRPQMRVGEALLLLDDRNPPEREVVTLVAVSDHVDITDASRSPRPGMRIFAAEYQIRNVGDRDLADKPFIGCRVAGANHYAARYRAIPVGKIGPRTALPAAVSLTPGQAIIGWVGFEVPRMLTVEDVQYQAGAR